MRSELGTAQLQLVICKFLEYFVSFMICCPKSKRIYCRQYETQYFGLERLTAEKIIAETGCKKPCNYKEYRRVGEPTRIFQFEDENKGLKLWIVSREIAEEVIWSVINKILYFYSGSHL